MEQKGFAKMTSSHTSALSKEASELLDHMEFISCAFLDPCPEVSELFKCGYLTAIESRWRGCVDFECEITTAGIARVKGLH